MQLRTTFRQLAKAPGYSAAVILTLVLAIGVNTAVFSMVDAFILRALPYPAPDRIAALVVHREATDPTSHAARSEEDDSFDGASWELLKANVNGVTFASWGGSGGANFKAGAASGGTVRYVVAQRVSANYFDVLGIPPYLGRGFNEEEDRPGGPRAVIVSYPLWVSTFNSDPEIVGKLVTLKGEPYTVAGVLPKGTVTPANADVFTPLRPATTGECGGPNCGIMIRLRPGVGWPQVNEQLAAIRLPYFSEVESRYHGRAFISARPLQEELAGRTGSRVAVLMLAVSFILLIACANLAGLVLVRIVRRLPEIATRLALGASRVVLLRQLWFENLALSLAGSLGGVALADVIVQGLSRVLPGEMVPVGGISIDHRVMLFSVGAGLFTSVVLGLLPALQMRHADLRTLMSAGSRTTTGRSLRLRQWLIGAEIALSVVLLAAAGLLIRTLIHLETQPPGFDPQNVIAAKLSLDDARYRDEASFRTFVAKSVDAMRAIPGIEDAAVGLSVPYERGLNNGFRIVDGAEAATNLRYGSSLGYVTPGYFSTLHIPLLAGRRIQETDVSTSEPVVVVNASFAKRFFRALAPIGRHIETDRTTFTIVGVVGDVAKRPGIQPRAPISIEPVIYIPASQVPQSLVNAGHLWFQPSWIVRTQGSIASIAASMQRALADAAPDLPFSGFFSMNDVMQKQLQLQRTEVLLLASLAGLALLLSAIGIYALISNLVIQRTREIGIRMALGSTLREAMLSIGSAGVRAAGCGIVAGLATSFIVLRVLSSEVYGTSTSDPITLVSVTLILAATALCATFLPALRIIRIDPASTLRE